MSAPHQIIYTEQVRSGAWRGATGKKLSNVVAIGIGGSYLGPLFVHTALTYDKDCQEQAQGRCVVDRGKWSGLLTCADRGREVLDRAGRPFLFSCCVSNTCSQLRFLANVDPVDVATALDGLNPEETLVVVVSKTFTTTETMLNARTARYGLGALRMNSQCLHQTPCSIRFSLPPAASGWCRSSGKRRWPSTWSPFPPTSSWWRSLALTPR